jgi:uncharacterized membrane protein
LRVLKLVLLFAMGIFYVVAGVNHFVNPGFYVNIMPPYLPWHEEFVFLSGVAEVVLGVAVLIPRTRTLGAWGIIALLIAVFPANVHVAWSDVPMLGSERGAGFLNWVRLLFQGVLIAWAWWYTRPPQEVEA